MNSLVDIEKVSFDHPVMLFDGVCIFCSKAIQFFIGIDKDEVIRYTTLQSEQGKLVMDKLKIPADKMSVVLVQKGEYFVKSDVTFQILKQMKFPWSILSVLRFLPRAFRDFFYDLIAKNRYKLFGKSEQCSLPVEAQKHLFLTQVT